MRIDSLIYLLTLTFFIGCTEPGANEPADMPIDTSEEVELYYYSKRDGIINIYKSDLAGNETPIIVDN